MYTRGASKQQPSTTLRRPSGERGPGKLLSEPGRHPSRVRHAAGVQREEHDREEGEGTRLVGRAEVHGHRVDQGRHPEAHLVRVEVTVGVGLGLAFMLGFGLRLGYGYGYGWGGGYG